MESFGDASLPIDCEWPTKEQLSKFPRDRMMKMNKVIYKRYNADHPITGFQLGFTNGITSDMFETEWGKENNSPESVDVDVSRKIRKVSMFIDPKGRGYLNRLKMLDE